MSEQKNNSAFPSSGLSGNRNEALASELSAFKSFGDHPELLENLPDIPQDLEWVKMGKKISQRIFGETQQTEYKAEEEFIVWPESQRGIYPEIDEYLNSLGFKKYDLPDQDERVIGYRFVSNTNSRVLECLVQDGCFHLREVKNFGIVDEERDDILINLIKYHSIDEFKFILSRDVGTGIAMTS